jgi:hypothetical protein
MQTTVMAERHFKHPEFERNCCAVENAQASTFKESRPAVASKLAKV